MIELKLTPKMWLPIAASLSHFGCLGMGISGGWECFQICNFIEMCVALGPNTHRHQIRAGEKCVCIMHIKCFHFRFDQIKVSTYFFFWHILYIFVYGYLDQSGGKLRESRISGPQLKCKTRVAAISIFTPMTGYNLGICVHLYIWPWSAVRWLIVNQPDTSLPALCSIIIASCMFYNADDHMYEHLALHCLQREKNIGYTVLYYYRNFEYS